MESGTGPRSVKIGDDERGGWTSDRPPREGGKPRVEDISVRNQVLRPSDTLQYSPGSLLLIVSPSTEEREGFAERHTSGSALLSRAKVRGMLEGRVPEDEIDAKTTELIQAAALKRLQAGDTVVVPLEGFDAEERDRWLRMAAASGRPRHLILLDVGQDELDDEGRAALADLRRRLAAGELGADGFHTALRLAGGAIGEVRHVVFEPRSRDN